MLLFEAKCCTTAAMISLHAYGLPIAGGSKACKKLTPKRRKSKRAQDADEPAMVELKPLELQEMDVLRSMCFTGTRVACKIQWNRRHGKAPTWIISLHVKDHQFLQLTEHRLVFAVDIAKYTMMAQLLETGLEIMNSICKNLDADEQENIGTLKMQGIYALNVSLHDLKGAVAC